MTIKFEWLLPFVMPFVLLGTTFLLFWVAGAPLTTEFRSASAFMSLVAGVPMGGLVLAFGFVDRGKSLGSFTIGKGE